MARRKIREGTEKRGERDGNKEESEGVRTGSRRDWKGKKWMEKGEGEEGTCPTLMFLPSDCSSTVPT